MNDDDDDLDDLTAIDMRELIERSSLGTPEAREHRKATPAWVREEIIAGLTDPDHAPAVCYRSPHARAGTIYVTGAVIRQRPATFARLDMVKIAAYVNGTSTDPVETGDDRLWILGEDLIVDLTEHGDPVCTVIVPAGFITDGASVPYLAQVLTGWKPWDEPQRWGAIVHDWLYCCNGRLNDRGTPGTIVAKDFADRAFRAVLTAAGAHWLRATVMYWAVHLFGDHAYRSDQATGPTIRVA